MTREVAERLRHWSRRVNEALEPEEAIEEAAPDEEQARVADDEAHPPVEPAPDAAPVGRDQGGIGHISDSRQD
ncbi:hypothetical protein [Halomonas alkalicola]|nr:hypothetical protein [Halomonas alkalicola]